MTLTFNLPGQGHILFLMVDYVGVHVKRVVPGSNAEIYNPKLRKLKLLNFFRPVKCDNKNTSCLLYFISLASVKP